MPPTTQSEMSSAEAPLLERLSSKLLPELKVYIERHRGHVEELIKKADEGSGLAASRRYARVIDGLLSAVFLAAKTAKSQTSEWCPLSLAAVGSYGRCSLSLFSDLDVRILVDSRPEDAQGPAESLLYPLWDAGLPIGHQVVAVEQVIELAKKDLPTATSLLDWRYLSGELALTEHFQERVFEEVFGTAGIADFIALLSQAGEKRRERFGGSVFLLEPDVKNGAGGLRDVDLAHWAARARWRVATLSELVQLGVLLPDEWDDMSRAINFLMRTRNGLHHCLRRRVDRLGFNEQELLAREMGYGKGGAGVEAFMSEYYRQARQIERTTEMILHRATPPPSRRPSEISIGQGLVLAGDKLRLGDQDEIFTEPSRVFVLYEEAVERGLRISTTSRRVIQRAANSPAFCKALRKDRRAAEAFRRLVANPKRTRFKYGSVLTELHEVGLLLAMIPEFAPVVGRVHHDIYHVYTVDVHSIAAVDMVRSMCRGDYEGRLASNLISRTERLEVLYFAALLHDVGKDVGGRGHAERGVVLAEGILTRLGFAPSEINTVQHLIRHHLDMYLVATRRDIDDQRTLERFSESISGTEGLQLLYLLTLADVATTSPGTLNPWKLRMLDELYLATERWLRVGDEVPDDDETIAEARGVLLEAALPKAFVERFLTTMPRRYFTANRPGLIQTHAELAAATAGKSPRFRVIRMDGPHAEIAISGEDRPGLLAQVTALFSRRKFKVVSAQIYSWGRPNERQAFDLFWVQTGADFHVTAQERSLTDDLEALVHSPQKLRAFVKGHAGDAHYSRRISPPVPVQVRVDQQGATSHTILEVIAKDRADLLFWTAETIYSHNCVIDLAKIHTEGARVTDVFYVCTQAGKKLTDEETEPLRLEIEQVLQRLEAK